MTDLSPWEERMLETIRKIDERLARGPACGLCAHVDLKPAAPLQSREPESFDWKFFPPTQSAFCRQIIAEVTNECGRGCPHFEKRLTVEEERVEKVAAAIYHAVRENGCWLIDWKRQVDDVRDQFRGLARTAITAAIGHAEIVSNAFQAFEVK